MLLRCLVDLLGAFAQITPQTRRLLAMPAKWAKQAGMRAVHSRVPAYQPKQLPSLEEQLGEAGVAKLIARYRRGATQQELADVHRVSRSSVKRLLRKRSIWLCLADEMQGG